jgi:hypothetical protein
MAYMLYKYIRKQIKARNQSHEVHGPELSLEDDHQSPVEKTIGSRSPDGILNGPTNQTSIGVISEKEKRAARIYRWKLVAGLCLPFSLQALETTIVAGALPFIASDFSQSRKL